MLNTRKGPAVQGLRLQIDKYAYNKLSYETLSNLENLTIAAGMADDILLNDVGAVCGIKTTDGTIYNSPTVVLTTGTFLNGLLHVGNVNTPGAAPTNKQLRAYLILYAS